MKTATHTLTFSGELLERGFWLYVWEITTPEKTHLYYVGRTGDSSSCHAQSPFNRMGQHLGPNDKNNRLFKHLKDKVINAELCGFRLIAYGPILKEADTKNEHSESRDTIAALEKALAVALGASGYDLLNKVNCRKTLDTNLWINVRNAFAEHFPRLKMAASIGEPEHE